MEAEAEEDQLWQDDWDDDETNDDFTDQLRKQFEDNAEKWRKKNCGIYVVSEFKRTRGDYVKFRDVSCHAAKRKEPVNVFPTIIHKYIPNQFVAMQ